MTRPFDVENNLVTVTKAYDMGLADGIAGQPSALLAFEHRRIEIHRLLPREQLLSKRCVGVGVAAVAVVVVVVVVVLLNTIFAVNHVQH